MGHFGYAWKYQTCVKNNFDLCWALVKYHSCCRLVTKQKNAISSNRSTSDLFCSIRVHTFGWFGSSVLCHVAYYVVTVTCQTFAANFNLKRVKHVCNIFLTQFWCVFCTKKIVVFFWFTLQPGLRLKIKRCHSEFYLRTSQLEDVWRKNHPNPVLAT